MESLGAIACCTVGSATPTDVRKLCAGEPAGLSTDLSERAKTNIVRNTPIEHKVKPVRKRRLKNADLEMSFFFIGVLSLEEGRLGRVCECSLEGGCQRN